MGARGQIFGPRGQNLRVGVEIWSGGVEIWSEGQIFGPRGKFEGRRSLLAILGRFGVKFGQFLVEILAYGGRWHQLGNQFGPVKNMALRKDFASPTWDRVPADLTDFGQNHPA